MQTTINKPSVIYLLQIVFAETPKHKSFASLKKAIKEMVKNRKCHNKPFIDLFQEDNVIDAMVIMFEEKRTFNHPTFELCKSGMEDYFRKCEKL